MLNKSEKIDPHRKTCSIVNENIMTRMICLCSDSFCFSLCCHFQLVKNSTIAFQTLLKFEGTFINSNAQCLYNLGSYTVTFHKINDKIMFSYVSKTRFFSLTVPRKNLKTLYEPGLI